MLTTFGITTVRALVDRMSEIGAEKAFLISPESNSEWTFAQLRQQSEQIARKLGKMGLAKGDKVAFLMDNGLFTSGLLLGAMYGGFVAVPLNVRAGRTHLAYTLDHCDTKVVFVSEDYRPLLDEVRGEIRSDVQMVVTDPDEGPGWDPVDAREGDLAEVYPDDDALLMYTSGNTGHPKGAVHSHQKFLAAASNSVLAHQLTAQDRSLCVLPLYHINGVNVTLVPTLMTGGSVVMPRRFLVRSFRDWIARYRCTWSALAPTIISQLVDWIDPRAEGLEEALGHIRFLRSSSAPLSPSLHRAFEEKFRLPLLEAMGSTECGGNVFSNPVPPGMANAEAPASSLPLLAPDEAQQILVEWNDTRKKFPQEHLLHRLVEEHARRNPASTAVACEGRSLSYGELDRRASLLARRLREWGVGPDVPVGVCMERSCELVVALLGVLKACGAYAPLDPDYPPERLAFTMADAAPPVLLSQSHLAGRLPPHTARVLLLDDHWGKEADVDETQELPDIGLTPEHLAYVIYTSGTTGRPKGVMNTHRGICNRLLWMQQQYRLGPGDTVLQKTPFSFDVSVWEFFWPLLAGARLVLARAGGHKDPPYLSGLIYKEQINVCHFVPSMLQAFLLEPDLEHSCASLRDVMCSGEALTYELQERFFARLPARLHNLYGPTEAAVDVTYWECRRRDARKVVPIGRPVANTQIHVLDGHLQEVPVGVEGELYLGGVQLARGYLNRPELTAERFIEHPQKGRLYKTGDIGRWLADGVVEYLGRRDHQVKLRGFRIELGEIEAILVQHPSVREALVQLREDRPGDKRLVAYVVSRQGPPPDSAQLRRHLERSLPAYMIPAAFVTLGDLPLTLNGKVDRGALPVPEKAWLESGAGYVAPRTTVEQQLAAIWAKLFELDRVGVHDSFFNLGGHSLLALRLVQRVNSRLRCRLGVADLFRKPTVAELAQHIALLRSGEMMPYTRHLVVVRRGNDGPPVVVVGYPEGLELLRQDLPADVPLWWLRLDGLHASPCTIREVPEIASAFAQELLSAAPSGPLIVFGCSFGGLIAFDLTRRLRQANRTVHCILLEPTSAGMVESPWPTSKAPSVFGSTSIGKWVYRHFVSLRSRAPSSWFEYFWNRTKTTSCVTVERLRIALCDPLPSHIPWSLRLKIRLGAALSNQRLDALRATTLLWWHYSPQVFDRARTYHPRPCLGLFHLCGRAEWLDTYSPTWRHLASTKLVECRGPHLRGNNSVTRLPAAEAWLELIRGWSAESAGTETRSYTEKRAKWQFEATNGAIDLRSAWIRSSKNSRASAKSLGEGGTDEHDQQPV